MMPTIHLMTVNVIPVCENYPENETIHASSSPGMVTCTGCLTKIASASQ